MTETCKFFQLAEVITETGAVNHLFWTFITFSLSLSLSSTYPRIGRCSRRAQIFFLLLSLEEESWLELATLVQG